MASSNPNYLDMMMETLMTQMMTHWNRNCQKPCANCLKGESGKEKKKKRKSYRHCVKSHSRISSDVTKIICVTKCIKRCRKSGNFKNRHKTGGYGRKSAASCSSNDSDSRSKYKTHGRGNIEGGARRQKEYDQHCETHSTICVEKSSGLLSSKPFKGCTRTCGVCEDAESADDEGPGLLESAYYADDANSCQPKNTDILLNARKYGLNTLEGQKQCTVEFTSCKRKGVDSSGEKNNLEVSKENIASPTLVRIKQCGKNIITLRCDQGDDLNFLDVKDERYKNDIISVAQEEQGRSISGNEADEDLDVCMNRCKHEIFHSRRNHNMSKLVGNQCEHRLNCSRLRNIRYDTCSDINSVNTTGNLYPPPPRTRANKLCDLGFAFSKRNCSTNGIDFEEGRYRVNCIERCNKPREEHWKPFVDCHKLLCPCVKQNVFSYMEPVHQDTIPKRQVMRQPVNADSATSDPMRKTETSTSSESNRTSSDDDEEEKPKETSKENKKTFDFFYGTLKQPEKYNKESRRKY